MELQYKKALAEYGLKSNQLPEDARIGIDQIEQVLKSIKMNESRGKSVSEKTYKKVKAMDKWVYYEILEMMDENENEEEEIPYSADEVIEELEEGVEESDEEEDDNDSEEEEEDDDETDFNEAPSGDPIKGQTIDADFKNAHDNGKTQITLEELKNVSKTAYNVIFENYDDSGDNGIVTTNYTLLETDEYVFTLEKN